MYSYKNQAMVLPLAMVDDLMGIANCGLDSFNLNIFINTQVEQSKMQCDACGKTFYNMSSARSTWNSYEHN